MYFSDEKAPEKRFKKILRLEPAWGVHQVSGKNNAREDWKLTDPDEVNAKSDGICWHVSPFFLLEQISVSPCVFCSTHRSQEDRIWARVLLSVKAMNKSVHYLGTIRKIRWFSSMFRLTLKEKNLTPSQSYVWHYVRITSYVRTATFIQAFSRRWNVSSVQNVA